MRRKTIVACALISLITTNVTQVSGQIAWTVSPAYETPISDFSKTALTIKDDTGADREIYEESHAVLIVNGQIGRAHV